MLYFKNIWEWIQNNFSYITAVAVLICLLLLLFLAVRAVKKDKLAKELQENIYATKTMHDKLNALTKSIDVIEKYTSDTVSANDTMLNKLKVLLEIQYLVYSQHDGLDSNLKNAISNLYTNVKYAETKTRADLIKSIEEMQEMLSEKDKEHAKKLEEAKKIIDVTSKNKTENTILRG